MADSKRSRSRFDLRNDEEWYARVERQAERLGLTMSAYIRQAVTLRLEQDEANDPRPKPRRQKPSES